VVKISGKIAIVIDESIENILSEYRYETRKKSHPEECPLYNMDVKCHKMDELNCYGCMCFYYDISKIEGGCLIDNPQNNGKWFEHQALPKGKIWDCSDCTFPHIEKNITEYLLNDMTVLKDEGKKH